jgi:uncharacterized protein DUF3443
MRAIRRFPVRNFFFFALFGSLLLATGCGGGGGSSNNGGSGGSGGGGAVANSVPIVVNAGLVNSANTAFASATVCVPGTSNCQTINNLVIDTGSTGLRILKSALTLPLTQTKGPTGNPLLNCGQFVSFFTWGPVMTADVKMAGEVASSVPIQVVGEADTGFSQIPPACKNSAQDGDSVQGLGGNGILGVGPFLQDCGGACSVATNNPGFYYECPSPSLCGPTAANVPTNQQVANPISFFASDNNGVVIQLPQVPAAGAPSVNGTMIFGIGTQSNNSLGNATVFTLASDGTFTTLFAGHSYPGSFIDSGSNGIFFLTTNDPGIAGTGIFNCTDSQGKQNGFYCTPQTVNLSATNQGTNSATKAVQFSVADANSLPASNTAFNDLTGSNPGSFDWGLGFFFGRTVFTAIEGQGTPGGTGPFFAY